MIHRLGWLGLVFLAGCAAGPPNADPPLPDPAGLAQQPWSDSPATPALQSNDYQGKTATQWGERLRSNYADQPHEASLALRALRDEGVPHLLGGLRSQSSDTRLVCLQALEPFDLVKHRAETFPLLIQFLRDREPAVRQQAAARLANFGKNARDALPALQQLAEQDDDAEVRNAAAGSIIDIQEALGGRRKADR